MKLTPSIWEKSNFKFLIKFALLFHETVFALIFSQVQAEKIALQKTKNLKQKKKIKILN